MLAWLAESVRAGEADLMHNHSLWMMPNVYPGWIAKKFDLPLVVSPRGTLSNWAFGSGSLVKRWFWPLVQHPALKPATCFHATSQTEYQDIRRMGFRQAVAIIPNGIDVPEWTPKAAGPMRTLLFLGRIHPVKGLDGLLRAWAAVQSRFPQWQLRVVGPDNRGYLLTMRQLAATLKLERVVFQGALFGADKWRAYGDADLFVLPTHSENFGMSVAEALAAGTPAIVTHGAPWQGLESHGAGWWIDSGVDPLVVGLESALSYSSSDLEAMGRQGRAWMDAEFSWQRIGKQMAHTYRWLIQGGTLPDWVRLD
jgi:glycosyltransferase involved in cell wall biosynthesis